MPDSKLKRLLQLRKRVENQLLLDLQKTVTNLQGIKNQLNDARDLKSSYLEEAGDENLRQSWIRRDRIQFALTIDLLVEKLQEQHEYHEHLVKEKRHEWRKASQHVNALESVIDKRLILEGTHNKRKDRRRMSEIRRYDR